MILDLMNLSRAAVGCEFPAVYTAVPEETAGDRRHIMNAMVMVERRASGNRETVQLTPQAPPVHTPLGTIIIYARDMQKTAAFYSRHFGFETTGEVREGLIELRAPNGGAGILIHQAAKSIKLGQVGVKLSFHVADVAAFAADAATRGLKFGTVHQANGYAFANAKDPDKNSVSISSRAFRQIAAP
jgi:predicted enzyme related to lactoylglutathione lyase